MKLPQLKVTWHHLREFVLGTRPVIWIEIENIGTDALLTTIGYIGNTPMGRGLYDLPKGDYVELGFFWNLGPIITDELISKDGCIHYSVYLRLENEQGSDQYAETKKIPVKRSQ